MIQAYSDLFAQALKHHRANRLGEAEKLYRDILTHNPKHADAMHMLALLASQVGRNDIAAGLLEQTVLLAPKSAILQAELGEMYRRTGRLAEAEAAGKRAVALDEKSFDGHYNLGLVLLERRMLGEAAGAFRRAAELSPGYAGAWGNLASVSRELGRTDEAIAAYQRVLAIEPEHAATHNNLGKLLHDAGRLAQAEQHYRQAIAADDRRAEAHQNLGMLLEKQGRKEEAIACYRAALERGVDSPAARYHMAALTGMEVPAAAPASHVVELFDQFAERFDEHLVEKLRYRTPQLLFNAVRAASAGDNFGEVIDLGCGTGLCAPLFKPHVRRLVGVDLSPAMIDKARQRALYDELHAADLLAIVRDKPAAFDLALAADVLVYFGDLDPVFAAVADSLRPNGLFAFSVEALEAGEFTLLPSRRYAHSATYLSRLSASYHFTELHRSRAALRQEAGQDVAGFIMVLRKTR